MRLVIADSNDLLRFGLRAVISKEISAEIVGEANNSDELVGIMQSFGADVVIIDFTAPGFSIDVLLTLKKRWPEVGILSITPDQSAQTLVDALRTGITSYVKKDCSIPEIIDAIIETSKGNKFFCGQILDTIQKANLDIDDLNSDTFSCDAVILSKRECEIIILIAEGNTNSQIADKLYLSSHTVNTHRKNIMSKLGVKNTAGIVMYAVKTDLISPNKFLFTAEKE